MRRLLAACLLPVVAWPGRAADEPLAQGKPIDYWVKQLKDDAALAREEALAVLANAGPGDVPGLPLNGDRTDAPRAAEGQATGRDRNPKTRRA